MNVQVRAMFADAKTAYRTRNALALLIEQDLQLARWLAGLHGLEARRDVSELVSSMVETGHMLPLLEDRLLTIIEASQVVVSPQGALCDYCTQFVKCVATAARLRVPICCVRPPVNRRRHIGCQNAAACGISHGSVKPS